MTALVPISRVQGAQQLTSHLRPQITPFLACTALRRWPRAALTSRLPTTCICTLVCLAAARRAASGVLAHMPAPAQHALACRRLARPRCRKKWWRSDDLKFLRMSS